MTSRTELDELDADGIVRYHAACLDAAKHGNPPPPTPPAQGWQAIDDNHRCNMALWDEEDQARRRDVPDSAIANSKRLIDGHNQRRNDAIERIDELLLAGLPAARDDARLHSETAGAMIDRLSILCLKIWHMDWQTRRADVDEAHRRLCRARHASLLEQRADLARCLDELLRGCRDGTRRFKVYRQFKMYNDPKFNPWLTTPSS